MNRDRTRLDDVVTRDLAAVQWLGVDEIRSRARRRRAARVAVAAAAVAAVLAVAWVAVPQWTSTDSRPADRLPGVGPGVLRGSDVGPQYRVNAWMLYNRSDPVPMWNLAELEDCPAYAGGKPPAITGHLGAYGVIANPVGGAAGSPVSETLVPFADPAPAAQVLADVRASVAACASYTAGRARTTVTVTAEGFAGDDSVWAEVREEPQGAATGRSDGRASVHTYLFVRVGRTVLLLTPSTTFDGGWLRGVAAAAVARLCTETPEC